MSYAFIHATVLDGTEKMKSMLDTTVLVDDEGKIVEVGPTAKVKMRGGEQIIDLQGKYLMPGLINMHVHLVGDGTPHSSSNAEGTVQKVTGNPVGMAILRHMLKASLKNQLASGVTTVRSVGDPGYADIQVRDQIKSGKFQGPRLIASGCGITVPEGHARLFAKKATTPEEGRALVHEHFSNGADQIKLFITGGVFDAEVEGEPGVLRMPLDIAQAVCDEAHKLGLRTSAHIESTEGVEVGLKAGVDTIEHGAPLTDELLKLFKKNGLGNASSLTCTLSPALPFAVLSPEKTHSTHVQKVNGRVVYEGVATATRQALANGIPVGLGTDSACPFVTHYDMWREVVYFQRHTGVTPEFALHTATLKNAQLLGVANETGSIETGKSADLIVLDANPLEDLCALRNVEQVYMAGKPVKYKAKHLPKIDAELDGIMDGLDNDPFVSEWNIAEEKKSLNPFAKRGTKE